LSLQWPTAAGMRRLCLVWLIAIACGAGVAATATPAYGLLNREAPDFALHAVVGGNVRLSEHRGDVIVLSFWGSRCTPCKAQLAALDKSLGTYRSAGLRIFGINVDDDQTRALEFAHARSVSFELLLDPGKDVSRSYEVDNLPMTVMIDRNGIIRHVMRDYSAKDQETYLRQLRELLNE